MPENADVVAVNSGGTGGSKGIRSDKEIYRALETRLREAQKPITCVDLMDDPDFRATAIAEYGTFIIGLWMVWGILTFMMIKSDFGNALTITAVCAWK